LRYLTATWPAPSAQPGLAGLFALALGVFLPATAQAYCRTTTVNLEASTDDPSLSGQCWPDGTPIAWPAGRVPYGVSAAGSTQVSAADATRIADLAFSAWNETSCTGGNPGVEAYDVGLLDYVPDGSECNPSTACQPTTNNVIYFRDDSWPYHSSIYTLALTTVSYGVNDGVIFEAYTEVNTAQYPFSIQTPPATGTYDLQSILTHEAGHFLGLAHSPDPSAVMYYSIVPEEVRTTLTADDVAGICAIYPPTHTGCSCATAPAGTGLLGMASALSVVWLAVARRTSRRRPHR
jgi:hypothetical protein